jgi:putative Mn2+ efflux pump MntP
MSIAGTSTIVTGIIIFLVGYWFLGKSVGQNECKDKSESTRSNYGGGIAGIVIGIILMIVGLVLNFMPPKEVPLQVEYADTSVSS